MDRNKIFYLSMLVAVGVCACLMTGGMDFRAVVLKPGEVAGAEESIENETEFDSEPMWTTNANKWSEMTSRLQRAAEKFPGRMGVYIKDLKTGEEWGYHADELFPSASLIKVPIMASVTRKIKEGDIKWDERLVMNREDKRGGSGKLRRVRSGTRLTVKELMFKMITESDNTAAHMLIGRVGYDYLQSEFENLGLKRTNISPEGMSLRSTPVKNEN